MDFHKQRVYKEGRRVSEENIQDENVQFEIYMPGDLEKHQEMKQLIISHFDGRDPLFRIFKERDWLDRVLTPKILSMEPNMLYSTREVAEICETEVHNINNKRRDLIDYVQPKKLDSFSYKHDYISIFKLKMIVELTVGDNSFFTVKQLRNIIEDPTNLDHNDDIPAWDGTKDLIKEFVDKYKDLKAVIEMLSTEQLQKEINKMVREEVNKQFKALPAIQDPDSLVKEVKEEVEYAVQNKLEQIKQTEEELKEKMIDIYQRILSPDTDIETKEHLLGEYNNLREQYPDHEVIIEMHRDIAEEKIKTFKNELKELRIKEVKEKVLKLFKIYQDESSTQSMKDEALNELEQLLLKEKDLEFEIRYYITQMVRDRKSNKKGFFRRLFGR